MIQIVVTTHGGLARELVKTAKMVVGDQQDLAAIGLEMHEGIEDLKRKITSLLKPVTREEDGCLMLVDMFGGTPSNVSLMLAQEYSIQVVAGVNLPMVIEAITHRGVMTLRNLARFVQEKGQKNIIHANPLLDQKHS